MLRYLRFQTLKLFLSLSSLHCFLKARNAFAEKPHMKINSLKTHKYVFLIITSRNKAFKGTVGNQALPSLHRGSQLKLIITNLKG